MLLTRWIKYEKLNIELESNNIEPIKLDFGLRSSNGRPINFVKYRFNSNDSGASIFEWLSDMQYMGTQYIGFFEIDYVKLWLSGKLSTDYYSKFVTDNFFVYDLNHVLTLNINIAVQHIDNPNINQPIIRTDGLLQWFKPPPYPVYNEDRSIRSYKSLPGEIDIVASNMYVYGILCDNPQYLIYSVNPYDNNDKILASYSNKNIALINNVLTLMRSQNFNNVYDNLLNKNELEQYFSQVIINDYINKLNEIYNANYNDNDIRNKIRDSINNDTINNTNFLGVFFNQDNNIRINLTIIPMDKALRLLGRIFDRLQRIDVNITKPNDTILMGRIIKYINYHFLNALINIASHLNNPNTTNQTIAIFNTVYNNIEIINGGNNTELEEAEKLYISEKRKYIELKKLYNTI